MNDERIEKIVRPVVEKWRKEKAHTYSSENADLYRGFENGRARSANELLALIEPLSELVRQAHAEAIEAADYKCEEVLQSRDLDDAKGIAAANLCGLAIQSLTPTLARIEAELRMAEARLEEHDAICGTCIAEGYVAYPEYGCTRGKSLWNTVAALRRERDAEIERMKHG